jgi:hypothetical protein
LQFSAPLLPKLGEALKGGKDPYWAAEENPSPYLKKLLPKHGILFSHIEE